MVLTCDARAELSKVTVPMLFIQPKQDRLVGLDRLEEMKEIKPERGDRDRSWPSSPASERT
jgi:hypothetical protein